MRQWKRYIVGCALVLGLTCLTACGTGNDDKNGTPNDGVNVEDTTPDNKDNSKNRNEEGIIPDMGNDIMDGVEDIGNDMRDGIGNGTNMNP